MTDLVKTHKRNREIVGYQLQDPHTGEYHETVAVYFKDLQHGDRVAYVDIKDLEPEDAS